MVPRTFRKQIVFGLISFGLLGALCLIYFFSRTLSQKEAVYSATGDALDLAVVDGIVAADKGATEEGSVKAVVVPHHLVASRSIALGIRALISSAPRLVVIISPDHYDRCTKLLCTTQGSYKTFFGDVSISKKEVAQLEKNYGLVADSNLFAEEHGVYAIVPFIKHYIPEAKIIPIVVSLRGRGTERARTEIIKLLQPLLVQKDVSLVISSDFSHYLSLAEANKMDVETQNSFCSGNSQEILNLRNPSQSDCPLCLWILEQEAQKLGFWNPSLITHTNSADLLHDASAKETTSHFTFILSATSSSSSCPVNIK